MAFTRSGYLAVWLATLLITPAAGLPSLLHYKRASSYNALGCFTDGQGDRALKDLNTADDGMTVESCAAFCSAYQYFGVEYGRQCYCGNAQAASSVAAPVEECSFACAGNSDELCGAGNRMNLYINTGYSATPSTTVGGFPYKGCYVDSPYARVLSDKSAPDDGMTLEMCAASCAGYAYFGVEYGRECYCGNSAPINAALEADCSFQCPGSRAETCGAGDRLNVYGPGAATPPTNTSPTPTPSPDVSGYAYQACYTDAADARVLSGIQESVDGMTLDMCATFCHGYPYFGVEYGVECHCGTAMSSTSAKAAESDCNSSCPGNALQKCGAGNRLNVYMLPGASIQPKIVRGFAYQACYDDSQTVRALADATYTSQDMTPQDCGAFCSGYAYFGVEFSTECYCGSTLSANTIDKSKCAYFCGGDSSQICGGPQRLSVYTSALPACSPSDEVVSVVSGPEHSAEAADFCRTYISVPSQTVIAATVTPISTVYVTVLTTKTTTLSTTTTATSTSVSVSLIVSTSKSTSATTTSTSTSSTYVYTIAQTRTSLSTTTTTTQTYTIVSYSYIAVRDLHAVSQLDARDEALPTYLSQYPASRVSSACSCLSLTGNTVLATTTAAAPQTSTSSVTSTVTETATSTAVVSTATTTKTTSTTTTTTTTPKTQSVTIVSVTYTTTYQSTITTTLVSTTKTYTTTSVSSTVNSPCANPTPLPDPSFENGGSQWSYHLVNQTSSMTYPNDPAGAHSGNSYALFTLGDKYTYGDLVYNWNVCNSRSFNISLWFRRDLAPSSPGCSLQIIIGSYFRAYPAYTKTDGGWQYFTTNYTHTAGSYTNVGFTVRGTCANQPGTFGGNVYMDDVLVTMYPLT